MKEHIHSRIAKILVVLALAVVASVMFVFVGCNNECAHENTHNEVVAAATCTTEGITRTVCDDCGHVTESKTAALGHDWDEGTVVAATCTAGGYTLQTCSRCTAQRQVEPTEPTGHTWDEGKVVAATCTAGGYTLQTCTACGAQQQVNPTEPTGHNYAIDESKTVAGTCLTNGSVTYVCANCGDTYTEQTALGQHKYEKVTVASTCTTAGYTVEVCSVCGHESNRTALPLVAHEYETVTVASTCTTAGYTAEVCSVCGAERNRVNLSLAAHSWKDDTEHSYAATCTVDGVDIEYCENCGITREYTLKATGHKWGETEVVAPTCTKDGYSIHTCTVCNTEQRYDTVEAAGHKWDKNKVLTEEATCTELGYYYTTCTVCGDRENLNTIPAKGHTLVWDDTAVVTYQTCTTDGKVDFVCEACDQTVSKTGDELKAIYDNADKTAYNAMKIPADVTAKAIDSANGYLQAAGHTYYSVLLKEENPTGLNDNEFKITVGDGGAKDTLYHKCQAIGSYGEGEDAVDYSNYALVCLNCEDCNVNVQGHTHAADEFDCVPTKDATDDPDLAWVCDVCGYEQEVIDHEIVLKSQATDGKWTADPIADRDGNVEYNCLNAQVCAVCGTVVADDGTHTRPDPEADRDAAYLANCQHGDLCTVCGKDVYGGKLDHKLVLVDDGVTVNGNTAIASTCTEAGLDVYACYTCMQLEAAGEDITWNALNKLPVSEGEITVGEGDDAEKLTTYNTKEGNIYISVTEKLGHDYYVGDHENGPIDDQYLNRVMVDENGNKIETPNCTLTYWWIDYCERCGQPRIEVKTAEDEGDNAESGRPWTNDKGMYFGAEGEDEHAWVYQLDIDSYYGEDGKLLPGMENFRTPKCNGEAGLFHATCGNDGCKMTSWESLTLDQYVEEYNKVNEPDVTKAELLEDQRFHADTMFVCGHPYCSACVPKDENHGVLQWSVSFQFAWDQAYEAELPTLDTFTAYYCWIDTVNMDKFKAYREAFESKYPDYTFTYYTDADHIDKADFTVIGADKGNDQYTSRITLYVEVTPKAVADVFGGIGWLANGSLSTDIHLNDTWVDLSEIDSIEIAYICPDRVDEFGRPLDNYVMASATSEGAGLEALKKVLKVNDKTKDWNFTCGYFLHPEYVDDLADPDGYWTWVINDSSFVATNGHYNTNTSGAGDVQNCSVRLTVTIGNNVMTWTMAF